MEIIRWAPTDPVIFSLSITPYSFTTRLVVLSHWIGTAVALTQPAGFREHLEEAEWGWNRRGLGWLTLGILGGGLGSKVAGVAGTAPG